MNHSNHNLKMNFERQSFRDSNFCYEPKDPYNFIKITEHGAPHPLIRWHHHQEYELHMITATNGKMFVGDYIGEFEPGNLVLIGPFLPHHWASNEIPESGITSRDISLHFSDEPFRKACKLLPEMRQILPLLDRAKNGIEFFGISDFAKEKLLKIKNKRGVYSFNEFLILMSKLSDHKDYRLLSGVQSKHHDAVKADQFNVIIDYIHKNYSSQFTMSDIAEKAGMESSKFSRSFSSSTGFTFTNFVNRIRINKACQLLSETDKYISTICYEIGYNTVANFNRRFVELKKVTPTEYRVMSKSKFN